MIAMKKSHAFFDSIALTGGMERFEAWELERVLEQLPRWEIRRDTWLLELGSGAGRLTPILEEAVGPEGVVVKIDLSVSMLARARAGKSSSLWTAGNAFSLPFAAASFDQLICFSVLPHLLNRDRAFAEMARVLRPGGFVTVAHSLSRTEINELHLSIGPPVDTHMLPAIEIMTEEATGAGLQCVRAEDGIKGFLLVLLRR